MTRAAAAAAALAALAFVATAPFEALRTAPMGEAVLYEFERGQQLAHRAGAPSLLPVSDMMPAGAVAAEAFDRFSGYDARTAFERWFAFVRGARFSLVLLAAWLAAGWPSALAAGLFFLRAPNLWLNPASTAFAMELSALSYLLVVCALLLRVERPGRASAAALGTALGCSVLIRSPLLPFLGVLAVREVWERRRGRGRPPAETALALGLPVLMLLPWMALNRVTNGTWSPIEFGRVGDNLLAGALGNVRIPEAAVGGGFAAAARVLVSDPLPFFTAVVKRLAWFATIEPPLLAAAAAAAWVLRRDPRARAVVLVLGALLGVHALVAVYEDFLHPVWPVAVVAASMLAAKIPRPRGWPDARAGTGAAAALATAPLAAAALLCALTLWRTSAYAAFAARHHLSSLETVERAARRAPDDPWLRRWLGEVLMTRGEYARAAAEFRAGHAVQPRIAPDWLEAWARLAADPAAKLPSAREEGSREDTLRWILLRAVSAMNAGDAKRTEYLLAAVRAGADLSCAKACSAAEMEGLFNTLLAAFPEATRAQVRRRLGMIPGQGAPGAVVVDRELRASRLLDAAAAAFAEGELERALAAAREAAGLSPGRVDARLTEATVLRRLGRDAEALGVVERALREAPTQTAPELMRLLEVTRNELSPGKKPKK